ncbi:MAG: hypothetical protein H6739_15485 [Alphaproteobacteria bacterium]|nr:hypothetical protein [Alphaproteobacteria bacterium]
MKHRRGNYIIAFAVALMFLLGFVALIVDIGYQRATQAQLQGVIDAAALAGAPYLDGTTAGVADARVSAKELASLNTANNASVSLHLNESNAADGEIVIGIWDTTNGVFNASRDETAVNAVQVNKTLTIDTNISFLTFGVQQLNASASTVAINPDPVGAGAVDCMLPIALADCMLDTYSEADLQSLELVFNPAGVDNVGWGRPSDHPNANWIRDQISDCESSGSAQVGDAVGLNNGMVTNALREIAAAVEDSDTSWDTTTWGAVPNQDGDSIIQSHYFGNTLEGPIILFDGGSDYCSGGGGSWNGSETITGFIWGAIYDVRTSGGASNKNVWVRLDVEGNHPVGTAPGGLDAGVLYQPPPRLVY